MRSINGVPFECTKCGECCRWGGYVWIVPEDIGRLAKHFNISSDNFIKEYTTDFRGDRVLKNKPQSEECLFLDNSNQCSVYNDRPTQCAEFPFKYDKRCPGFHINKDSSMQFNFEEAIKVVHDKISSSDYTKKVSDGLYNDLMKTVKSSSVAQEALECGLDPFFDNKKMKVANLADLFAFDRVDKKHLIHKSTRDLWSIEADSGGEVQITRLFDNSGEPIKG